MSAAPLPSAAEAATLRRVVTGDERLLQQLAALLVDVVEGGASVGFLHPLPVEEAREYWLGVLRSLGPELMLWVAEQGGRVVGTVQLAPCPKANGRHRADVQKLLVRRDCRGQGLSSRLLGALEAAAREDGRRLLVLDTEAGSTAEAVYLHLGWQRVGEIPDYALKADGQPVATVYFYKQL